MVSPACAKQYAALQHEASAHPFQDDNKEVDMNVDMHGRFLEPGAHDATRRTRALRFAGSALALWAFCAAGIYLIGPGEEAPAPSVAVAVQGIEPGSPAAHRQ